MTTYRLMDCDSGVTEDCGDLDLDGARERAEEWAREGEYGDVESTIWIDVRIEAMDGGGDDWEEVETVTVAIDPEEPGCLRGRSSHHWITDGAPGFGAVVRGHGGGVVCAWQCAYCGTRRIEDSWAQRPDNGVQGLESVRYEDGDAPSPSERAWETVEHEIAASDEMTWMAEVGEICDSDGDGAGVYCVRVAGYEESERYETEEAAIKAALDEVERLCEDREADLDRAAETAGIAAGRAVARALSAVEVP